MKKKVLFALIALFSFVSAWAADDLVLTGLENVSGQKGWVIGSALPGAKKGSKAVDAANISYFDAQGKPVTLDENTKVGWYFARIENGVDVYYLPFQAWKSVAFEYIDSEEAFRASVSGGALKLYYEEWIPKQTDPALKAAWEKERESFEYAADKNQDKTKNGEGFPWVVFTSTEAEPCRVMFAQKTDEDDEAFAANSPWALWHNGTKTGTPVFFSTTDKQYGVASMPQEYYSVAYSEDYENNPIACQLRYDADANSGEGGYLNGFNREFFNPETDLKVYFYPAELYAPELEGYVNYSWEMDPTSAAYTGSAIDPDIYVTAEVVNEDGEATEEDIDQFEADPNGENPNWIVKYFADKNGEPGEEVDEMVDKGNYWVQVYLPVVEEALVDDVPSAGDGDGDDEVEPTLIAIGDPQPFEITQTKVIITPAYVYKKYGQPDPKTPNFELTSGADMPQWMREEILKVVSFKRVEEADNYGEDKGMYKYFIDVARNQSNNNLDVVVTHNSSYLIIDPVPATISWTEDGLWKTYGDLDPNFKKILTINVPDYTYVNQWPLPEKEETEATDETEATEEAELTAEEQAVYDAELAAIQAIYANVTITRELGPVDGVYNEKGENVGFYDVTASLGTAAEVANFTLTETTWEDLFEIRPYDITPVAEVKEGDKIVTPADNKDDYVIDVKDVEYDGTEKKQEPTVTFYHNALGKILNLYKEGFEVAAATDENPAVIGNDYTLAWSGEFVNVTRKANTARDPEAASIVTVNAGTVETLNPNFIGEKEAKYAIKPAKLITSFRKDWTKGYGTADNPNILNPVFPAVGEEGGFKTEADKTLATTSPMSEENNFFIAKPVYKRAPGEEVGQYRIYAESVGTAQNYDITKGDEGLLTITKATLTISAIDYTKTFGAKDPEILPYAVDGWLEKDEHGDPIPFDMTHEFFTRQEGEAVRYGDEYYEIYPINATTSIGNYSVVFNPAKFQIVPAERMLVIIADDQSKTYGQNDPKFTYHAELFKGVDEETGEKIYVPFNLKKEYTDIIDTRIMREAGEDATRRDAETQIPTSFTPYDIYFDKQHYEDRADIPMLIDGYVPVYKSGVLNINKANLRVKYADETIKYGANPVYDIELVTDKTGKTDLAPNDQWSKVKPQIVATNLEFSGYPIYEIDEDGDIVKDKYGNPVIAKDGPGTYTITVDGGEIQNYIVHYNEGTLTVSAAGLTIWAIEQSADYKAKDKVYTIPAANLVPVKGLTIGVKDDAGVMPANFDYSTLVELSCTATKVGTNKKAITIKLKDGIDKYDVILENPNTTETDNGAADFIVNPLTEIHLAYGNVAQALEDHKGQENMTVFLPNRKLTAGLWYTFSLPFDFRVPDLSNKEQIYYCVADILDEEANDGNFHFVNTTGHIAANQPFLLKAEALDETATVAVTADVLETVSFAGVTIAAEDEDGNEFVYNDLAQAPFREDAAGNQFIAQYTGVAKDEFAADERVFGLNGEGGYQFGTPTKAIAPTVAFIGGVNTAASADVRIFIQEADGTVTEISAVDAAADAEFAEGWYTITGIKLDAKPTEKGVYIYNGKKVSIQ